MGEPSISVIHRAGLAYPDAESDYSPSERYPEYPFTSVARRPNDVYRAVRDCLAQAGLDPGRYGAPEWNPLRDLVRRGSRVFVLCNLVHHRRIGETVDEFAAKCTHGSVVRAVVDYLILAVGAEGTVRIGCAPIQSCRWDQVVGETGMAKVMAFYERAGAKVELCDLRTFVAERGLSGRVTRLETRDDGGLGVRVDLGGESLLNSPDRPEARFRVSDYDPRRIEEHHRNGSHVYAVHRYVLESDVVFSVPKLKTHQKVGITCALKGCVGAIARKDGLAHHRFGPPEKGGDEYPHDPSGIRQLLSRFHDRVWQSDPLSGAGALLRIVDRAVRRLQHRSGQVLAGSWHGNDTAWRMALDIARIVAHARHDGRLSRDVVRPHYVVVDGVVGGEGNGPLRPRPVQSGSILLARDPACADYVSAALMGFDPTRIPLVKRAFELDRYGLTESRFGVGHAVVNGTAMSMDETGPWSGHVYQAPPGWVGHVERVAP